MLGKAVSKEIQGTAPSANEDIDMMKVKAEQLDKRVKMGKKKPNQQRKKRRREMT